MAKVELLHVPAERNPLAVLWYEPRRPRGVTLVAGHGYSSSKQNLDFLCSFLASHGFGVYSLDFPGTSWERAVASCAASRIASRRWAASSRLRGSGATMHAIRSDTAWAE